MLQHSLRAPEEIDPANFRHVMGHLPTSVAVVAGLDAGGEPAGLAVGSLTSISLEPPIVGFCVAKTSTSWPRIRTRGRLCLNVLEAKQQAVSRAFARSGGDKFAELSWVPSSAAGAPRLADALAWIDIVVLDEITIGDHLLVTGAVLELEADSACTPLVFYRSGYSSLRNADEGVSSASRMEASS
ncbi:flavin reductase family protein [Rhodococcus koreensis]